MPRQSLIHPRGEPLPATTDEWNLRLVAKTKLKLVDEVHQFHLELVNDPEYRKFINPLWNEDAVEGSNKADDLEAAHLIRELAKDQRPNSLTAKATKHAIAGKLGFAQGRHNLSRRQRRQQALDQLTQQQADPTVADGDDDE